MEVFPTHIPFVFLIRLFLRLGFSWRCVVLREKDDPVQEHFHKKAFSDMMMGRKEMFGWYNNGPLSFYGFSLLFKDSWRYGSRVAGAVDDWAVVVYMLVLVNGFLGIIVCAFYNGTCCLLFVIISNRRTIEESHPPKATKPPSHHRTPSTRSHWLRQVSKLVPF